MKELACFASGIFNYSANLAFRILAILFDFALMVTFACIADPQWSVCSIVQRKVLNYFEEMPVNAAPHRLQCFRASVFIIIVKLFKSVFYGISVCIGIFICICYSEIKKHGTNQSPAAETLPLATKLLPTVQMTNPQTIQTVMIDGQLMQVVTPANQLAAQQTVDISGNIAENKPQMLIVQNPSNH